MSLVDCGRARNHVARQRGDHPDRSTGATSHSARERQRLLGRINRLQGQLNGLKRQLEHDDFDADICHDVMSLLASIKGATQGLTETFLEGYVKDLLLKGKHAPDPALLDDFMEVIKTFRA